jgi:hypothetical protein
MNDIEVEIRNQFYRPSKRSIDIYREKMHALHATIDKATAPSKKRLFKLWSLLLTVAALSAVAQAHA